MKCLSRISIIIELLLLVGCQVIISTPATLPSFAPTKIIPSFTPTIVPSLVTSTVTPTFTSTPRLTWGYQQECLTVNSILPDGFLSDGAIILWDEDANGKVYLSALSTLDNTIQRLPDKNIADEIVSPDGKRMAVDGWDFASVKIMTSNGQILSSIPFDQNWDLWRWLDTQQLVILTGSDTQVILNTLTGKITRMSFSSETYSVYDKTAPVYDPSLTRVVYQRNRLSEYVVKMVLWDLNGDRELWHADIGDNFWNSQPVWSPDGNRFAAGIPTAGPSSISQLITVDREGKFTQLTNLGGDASQEITVEKPQWSPDSQYIAFWLNGDLAVFNTKTQETIDYCLPSGDHTGSVYPYWSPDSRQIVLNGQEPNQKNVNIIVVDVEKGEAVEIPGRAFLVIGWMTK